LEGELVQLAIEEVGEVRGVALYCLNDMKGVIDGEVLLIKEVEQLGRIGEFDEFGKQSAGSNGNEREYK
jgi:hypothetical protein